MNTPDDPHRPRHSNKRRISDLLFSLLFLTVYIPKLTQTRLSSTSASSLVPFLFFYTLSLVLSYQFTFSIATLSLSSMHAFTTVYPLIFTFPFVTLPYFPQLPLSACFIIVSPSVSLLSYPTVSHFLYTFSTTIPISSYIYNLQLYYFVLVLGYISLSIPSWTFASSLTFISHPSVIPSLDTS